MFLVLIIEHFLRYAKKKKTVHYSKNVQLRKRIVLNVFCVGHQRTQNVQAQINLFL